MNESKSSRYHRLQRLMGIASVVVSTAIVGTALLVRPAVPLPIFAGGLVVLSAVATLPLAYYGGVVLEHRYGLSAQARHAWLGDQFKGLAISCLLAIAAAEFVYALIRWSTTWWWIPAGAGAALLLIVLTRIGPVLILPLFYRFTPLERPALRDRLIALSERAGVPVLGVYEWALGAKTRRANAALTGAGGTRRILLSDTLLANYTDDEIEVILAHELAHHVHRDIPRSLAIESAVLLCGFFVASVCLRWAAAPLGLIGPEDPRGLPVVVLAMGAVTLLATPLLNAISRANERRADAFALELTGRRDAFVTAMRRLGSQNLSEENPSRMAVWFFHTHPPIEDRIASAAHPARP